jgi:hypothetical protein
VLAVHAFYLINGYLLMPDHSQLMYLAIDAAVDRADIEKIADQFALWTEPLPDD